MICVRSAGLTATATERSLETPFAVCRAVTLSPPRSGANPVEVQCPETSARATMPRATPFTNTVTVAPDSAASPLTVVPPALIGQQVWVEAA